MSQKRQVRIYVEPEDEPMFAALQAGGPLADTQLASVLLSAALRAIRENGGRATLPLRLQVVDAAAVEKPAASPKRRAA